MDSTELVGPARPAKVNLAVFNESPQIDGKLSEGEWDQAARLQGFLASGNSAWSKWTGSGWLEPRSGYTMFGFTAERLYVAVVSELPPDFTLITKQSNDEVVQTVGDDSIELWVWDPTAPTTQYQMITNSVGATFDIKHAAVSSDQGWNADWQMANTIDKENNVWVCEISVPFADFGLTGDVMGRDIGLLLARNFKRPWEQGTAMPASITFRSPDSYGRLHLSENNPVVRVESLGEYGNNAYGSLYDEANLKLRLSIVNPGPARKAKVSVATQSTDMPNKGEDKVIELPANGAAEYAFTLAPNMYHNTAGHLLNFSVGDEEGEQTWLSTGMMWTQAKDLGWKKRREKIWGVQLGPNPDSVTRLWYYPSYNSLRIQIDPSYLGAEFQDPQKASVTLTDAQGKVLTSESVTWEKAPHTQWIDVPELADGMYTVSTTIPGYSDPLKDTFARKHFEWEGNQLGITDEVLAPFTPIEVKGNTVGVVLRQYEMTGLGLWKSVQAQGQEKDEASKELLTGPIVLVADGDQVIEGSGKFTEQAPNKIVYEGSAQTAAVKITTHNTIEEDGCMKVELTLAPGSKQQELKSLSLRIPLKDKMAPLYHVSSTTLRTNPAGTTPAGDGVVWTSDNYPTGVWYENFHPYIWLGAESRGLCWFADNDAGWVIDPDRKEGKAKPPQELIREGDTLTLQINLVQMPVVLDKAHKIVFGLMASPAKPMPKDWRSMARSDGRGMTFTMGHNFGLPASYSAKYPIGKDMSAFDMSLDIRRGKGGDREAFLDAWMKRNVTDETPAELQERIRKGLALSMTRSQQAGDGYFTAYFDEFHSTSMFMEEAKYYFSEWSGNPLPDIYPDVIRAAGDWGASFGSRGIVPSYRDFAVYYGAQWLKRGVGLNFDNAFPNTNSIPLTSSAYELPNGQVQPSAGMWERREYLRRMWTLHQQLRLTDTPQLMYVHMTNTHIVPYMVWNEANLDMEWKVSTQPIQSKFVPDLIRAESIGLQTGNIPTAFSTVRGDPQSNRVSEMALLVHEIQVGLGASEYPAAVQEFGYGLPDCKITRYWDENPPLEISDDQCKWLLLERGGQKMIVLATWNSNPSEVTIRLQKPPAGASDAESSEALQVSNGVVTVPMEGYGARIIVLK